ncbi:hypothetical protein D9M72_76090 [compost metagenome]|jgi:hypothetical protein
MPILGACRIWLAAFLLGLGGGAAAGGPDAALLAAAGGGERVSIAFNYQSVFLIN